MEVQRILLLAICVLAARIVAFLLIFRFLVTFILFIAFIIQFSDFIQPFHWVTIVP